MGYRLQNLDIDSTYLRKHNPFLYDPEIWSWMERNALKNVTFIDPYHWSQNHHLGPDAVGIQSLGFDPRKNRVIQASSDVIWKKIKPSFLDNSLYYNLKRLRTGEDKNHGFIGRKNRIAFDPIPALHNGIYKVEYSRSILKHIMVNAGYGIISRSGDFNHVAKDSSQVEYTEHLSYINYGTIWSLSVLWNLDGSGLPVPMGWYAEAGIERIRNQFSEQDDTSLFAFTYDNRSLSFNLMTGTNIWLGKGFCLDIGIKAGLLLGNVIPMNSASAYRVPVRQYPDAFLWEPENAFSYNLADDDVNGTGAGAFATFRLYYSKLILYPVFKLAYLF